MVCVVSSTGFLVIRQPFQLCSIGEGPKAAPRKSHTSYVQPYRGESVFTQCVMFVYRMIEVAIKTQSSLDVPVLCHSELMLFHL